MKSITKSLISMAASTVAAVCVLTTTALASTGGIKSQHVLEIQPGTSTWTVVDGIDTNNVNSFWEEFYQPKNCNIGLGGYKSALYADNAHSGNYKWASVTVRNENTNNVKTASTPESQRNNKNVSATAASVDTITQGEYYTFLKDGTGAGSNILERSYVTVNRIL